MILERISRLANAYKEDKEIIEMVNDTMNSFSEYVKAVNEMENTVRIIRFKLEPEEYRERVENLDRNRRIIHNGVIAGVKYLNRLCKAEDLEPFFEGDVTDRVAIGDFAMTVTKEIFDNRQR